MFWVVLKATLDIFLIFLTADEEEAARSESMGGRKNLGLDAGRRFTVNVSVLPGRSPIPEEARLDRLLSEWFPSSSWRNESLLLRALPWIEGGCKPRRLVDCPILLKAAPRTQDSEDDMPSLSKESGQSPIPSIYLLSRYLATTPTNQLLFLFHWTTCLFHSTFLPVRQYCHLAAPPATYLARLLEPTTTLVDCYCNCLLHSKELQCLPCLPAEARILMLLWLHHHLVFEGSPGSLHQSFRTSPHRKFVFSA